MRLPGTMSFLPHPSGVASLTLITAGSWQSQYPSPVIQLYGEKKIKPLTNVPRKLTLKTWQHIFLCAKITAQRTQLKALHQRLHRWTRSAVRFADLTAGAVFFYPYPKNSTQQNPCQGAWKYFQKFLRFQSVPKLARFGGDITLMILRCVGLRLP